MWLLHTKQFTLRHFERPPPKYAILSHVWRRDEPSFSDFSTTQPKNISGTFGKIACCCRQARLEGFDWVWIDTCCIDKTNSVELSEAINSMYQWYANATVCYAYLYDVAPGENPGAPDSSFRRSVWFTRGWTLQELVAPGEVVFFSREWSVLGTKDFFADLLQEITRIDADVLVHRVPLASVPVARRLSWASGRKTTRVEDEAYCLMGIFDINMPTIYGEGARSFRRLYEEIMRFSLDHTLFTWGASLTVPSSTLFQPVYSVPSTASVEAASQQYRVFEKPLKKLDPQFNLLPSSARAFVAWDSTNVSPELASKRHPVTMPHRVFMQSLSTLLPSSDQQEPPYASRSNVSCSLLGVHSLKLIVNASIQLNTVLEFTFTSHGIRAHVPLVRLSRDLIDPRSPQDPSTEFYVALLACRMDDPSSIAIGLLLRRFGDSYLYRVGAHLKGGFARYVSITKPELPSTVSGQEISTLEWSDIYILQQNRTFGSSKRLDFHSPSAPRYVVVPLWVVNTLQAIGFNSALPDPHIKRLLHPRKVQTYAFECQSSNEELRVHVGWCSSLGLLVYAEVVDIPSSNVISTMGNDAKPEGTSFVPSICLDCSKTTPRHTMSWMSNAPSVNTPLHSPPLDTSGLRWKSHRTLSALDRTVHLRVAESAVARGRPDGGSIFVLGIAPAAPWNTAQAIPAGSQSAAPLGPPSGPIFAPEPPPHAAIQPPKPRRTLLSRLLPALASSRGKRK